MPKFSKLLVTDIYNTTREAVVINLRPENPLEFNFMQGQYLTFKKKIRGNQIRRSYSICSSESESLLQVAIKKVEGGVFSNWANTELQSGDFIYSLPPRGSFYADVEGIGEEYLAVAGGSGITPILSILKTTLSKSSSSRFTLIYSNRNINTVMFREELEDLKNIYMSRLNLVHIFTEEKENKDIFSTRLNVENAQKLLRHLIKIDDIKLAFLCGPELLMSEISAALQNMGLKKTFIRREFFQSDNATVRRAIVHPDTKMDHHLKISEAKITLDGDLHSFNFDKKSSLLQAALDNAVDAPYACRAGVCSTCKAKVTKGDVEMISNYSLEDHEVEQGFVLTCQAYAKSKKISWDYDVGY